MSDPVQLAKKLHRLVVTSNANEAAVAASKLSDLVRIHSLRLSDLDVAGEPTVIYRDRIIEKTVEVPVYRDRVIEKIIEVPAYRDRFVDRYIEVKPSPARARATRPLRVRHHKVDDDGYCMQKCVCGEWFMDSQFLTHVNQSNG